MNYSTGAILNDPDVRDIQLASVQKPVQLPDACSADMSAMPIEDQGYQNACVGFAIAKVIQWQKYRDTKVLVQLSPRFIYGMAKSMDGYPSLEGTQPRFGAKVTYQYGCATNSSVPNNVTLPPADYKSINLSPYVVADADPRRTAGYTFVDSSNAESLKQALFQNGVITISLMVGDFSSGLVHPGTNGIHYVVLYGYLDMADGDTEFFFQNSWGPSWGNNGRGQFIWSEWQGKVFDAMAFVDIPSEAIASAKSTPFAFTRQMARGSRGTDVYQLQSKLGIPSDGIFGSNTASAVKTFQSNNGLWADGIVGSKTLLELNGMQTVTITRHSDNGTETLGNLVTDGFSCYTLELPWKNNQSNISCIPTGTYRCEWSHMGNLNIDTYEVKNVPGRDGVFFHFGDFVTDSEGCILVGKTQFDLNGDGQVDITSTRDTLQAMNTKLAKAPFILIIK